MGLSARGFTIRWVQSSTTTMASSSPHQSSSLDTSRSSLAWARGSSSTLPRVYSRSCLQHHDLSSCDSIQRNGRRTQRLHQQSRLADVASGSLANHPRSPSFIPTRSTRSTRSELEQTTESHANHPRKEGKRKESNRVILAVARVKSMEIIAWPRQRHPI